MRELKAAGPLTGTLMAVVAVDDGLAIMIFGIAVSAARHMVGPGATSIMTSVGSSLVEILGSLVIGVATGLLIDFIIHRLNRRGEMLTIGLGLVLLGGESARLLHLSPLLVGMATGFTVVNRDRRDVRLFRTINAFEPPIYVLFFTLAGTHLHISALAVAGWVGLVYFFLRALGKFLGTRVGARAAGAPRAVRNSLGLALIPQAGVAIGLIFLIQGDAVLQTFSATIIPVVLASVVLSELVGPVCARWAVVRAGESGVDNVKPKKWEEKVKKTSSPLPSSAGVQLVPWSWERLTPAPHPKGHVLIGLETMATAGSLARMGCLLAHQLGARPIAVTVLTPGAEERDGIDVNFGLAGAEVQNLGYELVTETFPADTAASGLLSASHRHNARAIVLGHPRVETQQGFQRVVESVAQKAQRQVVVVRAAGILHTERILVPIVNFGELGVVRDVVHALAGVGIHRITLFTTLPSDALEDDLEEAEDELIRWAEEERLVSLVRCHAIATEARLEAIVDEAAGHDVLIMAASPLRGLRKMFFGSVAEDVAQRCGKPMIMVYMPHL
jgi:nucleotide-binding universal stress UspA family protein